MPFARCKFYTESGEPVKGGCRRIGAGCAFIHPDDPNWSKARPSSSGAREKSGDSGSFRSRGGRSVPATSSEWGTAGNTSATETSNGWDRDTSSGWGTGSGWGNDSGGGWGAGWGKEETTSTSNQASAHARSVDASVTKSKDSALTAGWGQSEVAPTANGHAKSNESGWGSGASNAAGSGWGNSGNEGWGNARETDKPAESEGGSTHNDGWGGGWGWGDKNSGEDKDAGSADRSARNDTWGAGWGVNMDATSSSGVANTTIAGSQQPEQKKRKTVPAPSRLRIPDNERRTAKITGTNNEPLSGNRWGESRISNIVTAPAPATTTTPITAITPTESTRVKRKHDVAFDENLDVFKEYIKAWERGVRARFLLLEAESKRDRWFRTQKSACYARIGEAGRKRLDGQRTECDKEVIASKEKLSAAITSLTKFHETSSSTLDLGQRYAVGEEAERFIAESRAFVDEVRRLLVAQVLKDKNDKKDVQSDNTQQRPSEAGDTSVHTLRSQIRDLEERFDQAQTELSLRHPRDIGPEIDELLIAKIASMRVDRQLEIDRIAAQPRPEIVIPPAALLKMEETAQQVRALDAKIPNTVEDIRILLLRVDATTKRVNELEEEVSTNREAYKKQLQEMVAEKEKIARRVDEQLVQIRDQFGQLVTPRLPSDPAQPAISPATESSREMLIESLRPAFEAVVDKFYEREVQPAIGSMQQNVVNASERLQQEAIQVLWGKIKPAMNMVAEVSRWLDSQELGHTAPRSSHGVQGQ